MSLAAAVAMLMSGSAYATLITKSPDLGSYWWPLSAAGGTYVYSDSFVAPQSGVVTSLGTWLDTQISDAATAVKFQVWGSVGNNAANGPDYANVLATTTGISGMSGPLSFYSGATPSSLLLTGGDTYWFSATVVGAAGNGQYQVGGHTQNSVYSDNGTFWFSNDKAGQNFDGQHLTPEMAFQVEMTPVPEPSTYITGAMLALVFGVQGVRSLRSRKQVA